jgi:VanZ family protein
MDSTNGILIGMLTKRLQHLSNAYLPPLIWAGVIYLLSAQSMLPSFSVSLHDFLFKKSMHMFVYAVLYFLLYRGVNLGKKLSTANWWLPMIFCLAYALLDELHQYFTPQRHPSLRDVGYDMLGVMIVFLRKYKYI